MTPSPKQNEARFSATPSAGSQGLSDTGLQQRPSLLCLTMTETMSAGSKGQRSLRMTLSLGACGTTERGCLDKDEKILPSDIGMASNSNQGQDIIW